jgi:hypothetical protein
MSYDLDDLLQRGLLVQVSYVQYVKAKVETDIINAYKVVEDRDKCMEFVIYKHGMLNVGRCSICG